MAHHALEEPKPPPQPEPPPKPEPPPEPEPEGPPIHMAPFIVREQDEPKPEPPTPEPEPEPPKPSPSPSRRSTWLHSSNAPANRCHGSGDRRFSSFTGKGIRHSSPLR